MWFWREPVIDIAEACKWSFHNSPLTRLLCASQSEKATRICIPARLLNEVSSGSKPVTLHEFLVQSGGSYYSPQHLPTSTPTHLNTLHPCVAPQRNALPIETASNSDKNSSTEQQEQSLSACYGVTLQDMHVRVHADAACSRMMALLTPGFSGTGCSMPAQHPH